MSEASLRPAELRHLTLADLSAPLDYTALFGRNAPVQMEIGSGRGDFLIRYAAVRPDLNLLGVERKLTILRRAEHKVRYFKASNVLLLHAEIRHLLEEYIPPASLDAIHIYFPDPWPKKRHAKRRVIREGMPDLLGRALVMGGCLHIRTDVEAYYAEIMRLMEACPLFVLVTPPNDLEPIRTAYEDKFLRHGKVIYRASFRRAGPPAQVLA